MSQVYIYDAIRSARTRAKSDGGLASLTPVQLMAGLYEHIKTRNTLDPQLVEEVALGSYIAPCYYCQRINRRFAILIDEQFHSRQNSMHR